MRRVHRLHDVPHRGPEHAAQVMGGGGLEGHPVTMDRVRGQVQEAGHAREPRVSVSRSIFALTDKRDWTYFGARNEDEDQVGFIDAETQAIFGRSYAAEPDTLIEQLKQDEAIAEADTLLLTVPNQLGVAYNAHVLEAILTHVAPAMGWR